MSVVLDCSAKYEGRSLNEELLQGPDLVNLMVGALIRFRKELVAYSTDLEACFHQISIPPEHKRFFSFLWWLEGHTPKAIQDVCACDERRWLEREFYVDNLLTLSATDGEAVSSFPNNCCMQGRGI